MVRPRACRHDRLRVRPGRRTRGWTRRGMRINRPRGRRRSGRRGIGRHAVGSRHAVGNRRQCAGSLLPRPQQRHRAGGGRWPNLADHPGHDVGVLPPLQAARRQARAEAADAAAVRHDGPRQLRPVRVARPDAAAAAGPGDLIAIFAADRGCQLLHRPRRQVRAVVPPGRQPVAATARGEAML